MSELKGGEKEVANNKKIQDIAYKIMDIKNDINEKLKEIEVITQKLSKIWYELEQII